MTRVLLGSFTALMGVYDLYHFATCEPHDQTQYFWLVAGLICICGSGYIFSSKNIND